MRIKVFLFLVCVAVGLGASAQVVTPKASDIVILYDNDVHCAVDGYAKMAALRDDLKRHSPYVSVVSNGDFLSGSSLGAFSKGEYIVRIMNVVGYDNITLGNHEFDYRIPQLLHLDSMLTAHTLCCNFHSTATHAPVFDDYVIKQYGDRRVAFVGVTTPATVSSSSPIYFMDTLGAMAYTFCADSVFGVVQRRVDAARRSGADYVVALSHLGDDEDAYTSLEMIASTTGIDVVLDGHSHSTIEHWRLPNRNGDTVLLTSTGTAFANIGMLLIPNEGRISTRLISVATLTDIDAAVADTIASIRAEYDAIGQQPVGKCKATLPARNSLGHRIPRMQECAIGDFCAEAFRAVMNTDIGWVNGGAFRTDIKKGPLVFNDIYAVFPFDNRVVVASVTGQDILDALEAASATVPIPNGRFAQVAGLRYSIDTTVATPVVFDSSEVLVEINGPRRVSGVMVFNRQSKRFEPIAPQGRYTIATTDYVLNLMGAGFSFPSKKLILSSLMSDAQLVAYYISHNLNGVIKKNASKLAGNITFK